MRRSPSRRGLWMPIALVAAVALVPVALIAPPLVPPDPAQAGRVRVDVVGPDQPIEVINSPVSTGRWDISITLDARFVALSALPMTCRLVEQTSGVALDDELTWTVRSGVGTAMTAQLYLDLPAMTIAVQCTTPSLSFGLVDLREASITVRAVG